MATTERRKMSLEKHRFKLLLQALSIFIFIVSTVLIALGVINATFVYKASETPQYPLVTDGTYNNCQRYTGVHLGIPGLIIALAGLILSAVVATKQIALIILGIHLLLCLLGFVIATIITDLEVQACLNAQSEYLKQFYFSENERQANYKKDYNWANLRVNYEFPDRQFPVVTYVIIATHYGLLVTVVTQIAAYLLSALLVGIGLVAAILSKKTDGREAVPTEEHDPHGAQQKGIQRYYVP